MAHVVVAVDDGGCYCKAVAHNRRSIEPVAMHGAVLGTRLRSALDRLSSA